VPLVQLVDKEMSVQVVVVVEINQLWNQLLFPLQKVDFLFCFIDSFYFDLFSINIQHLLNGMSSANFNNHWRNSMNSIVRCCFCYDKK
jgi:hypothetical protein